MTTDTWGFLIAGLVGVALVARWLLRKAPAETLTSLATEARTLGLEGADLETGLVGTVEGREVRVSLSTEPMRRTGQAGTQGVVLVCIRVHAAAPAFWVADANLVSRRRPPLAAIGERRTLAGMTADAAPETLRSLEGAADRIEALRTTNLQKLSSDGQALEALFSPYRKTGVDLSGRVTEMLETTLACVEELAPLSVARD